MKGRYVNMKSFSTKYGILNDVSRYSTHDNGELDSLCLHSENIIDTPIGSLIPRYKDYSGRRKNVKCLSFYPKGSIKSIDLQEQTDINTPIGIIAAELITFYENGAINKIFPLNGSINGMWSEEDEIELARTIAFNLLNTDFNLKINSFSFYPSGTIASISFYSGLTASVPTRYGIIETRIGFSLTESGNLLTLEPNSPYEIDTPIGILHAYNANAVGIHADRNSLVFDPYTHIVSELATSTDIIKITDNTGNLHYLAPSFVESSLIDGENELVSLKIKFNKESITFSCLKEFTINMNDIANIKLSSIPMVTSNCTDCSTCRKCGN